MEQNTVKISLDEYNSLRDFKKEIEVYHTIKICKNYFGYTSISTLDDASEKLAKEIKRLNEEINNLKNPDKEQPTIDEIKEMSLWQLYKLKKSWNKK